VSFGMAVAFMMFIKELRRNGGETNGFKKWHIRPPPLVKLFGVRMSLFVP